MRQVLKTCKVDFGKILLEIHEQIFSSLNCEESLKWLKRLFTRPRRSIGALGWPRRSIGALGWSRRSIGALGWSRRSIGRV